ncbi:hypothetical protein MAR_021153 [Mya arenaria]|uniref:Uncharacterized protein n=1 Tax=Mya arenaria TaxID=6604 RepID=A0ABY7E9H1_MYAAR|nr:hypothetical protein MAR_021153 [Mya arenaria]
MKSPNIKKVNLARHLPRANLPDEVENPMYESSQPAAMKQDSPDVLYALPKKKDGDIYAVVDKANKRPTKSQGTKKQKNDAHDNAGFDIYENNQSPQHPAKRSDKSVQFYWTVK